MRHKDPLCSPFPLCLRGLQSPHVVQCRFSGSKKMRAESGNPKPDSALGIAPSRGKAVAKVASFAKVASLKCSVFSKEKCTINNQRATGLRVRDQQRQVFLFQSKINDRQSSIVNPSAVRKRHMLGNHSVPLHFDVRRWTFDVRLFDVRCSISSPHATRRRRRSPAPISRPTRALVGSGTAVQVRVLPPVKVNEPSIDGALMLVLLPPLRL